MTDSEQQFLERARASLDERAAQLEPRLNARLQAARREALASRRPGLRYGWAGAAAAALTLVLAVGIWSVQDADQPPSPVPSLAYVEQPADLAMLTSIEEPELVEELDFYLWLAKQEQLSFNDYGEPTSTTSRGSHST